MTISAAHAHAGAKISTSTSANFARVSFAWDKKTPMTFSISGNTITLGFSNPLEADVGSISASLRPYVRGVTRTPNGKRVIITLSKPYRVRQFSSGTTNGIDIVTKQEQAAISDDTMQIKPPATASKPITRPAILSTKAQPKPLQSPTPAMPAASQHITSPVPKPVKIYSTKTKPDPKAAAVKEAPVTPPKAVSTSPVKPKTIAEALKEPKAAPQKVLPVATVLPKSKPLSGGTLMIGALKGEKQPTLEFLWPSRVALATFARGNDVWAIFSESARINTANLISTLPSGVTHVEAFGFKGATVLRFTSEKPVYPSAKHVAGTYHWRLVFGEAPVKKTEISYDVRNAHHKTTLLFDALDSAAPVSFYDPVFQDKLLVAPCYDDGHHVTMARSIAGSDILTTGQGIAEIGRASCRERV